MEKKNVFNELVTANNIYFPFLLKICYILSILIFVISLILVCFTPIIVYSNGTTFVQPLYYTFFDLMDIFKDSNNSYIFIFLFLFELLFVFCCLALIITNRLSKKSDESLFHQQDEKNNKAGKLAAVFWIISGFLLGATCGAGYFCFDEIIRSDYFTDNPLWKASISWELILSAILFLVACLLSSVPHRIISSLRKRYENGGISTNELLYRLNKYNSIFKTKQENVENLSVNFQEKSNDEKK